MTQPAEYFRIAYTNLTHRRTRSYLTMVGIFIGIAAVVSLISLGQGLRQGVAEQFASIGTDKVIVVAKSAGFGPPGEGAVSNLTTKDLRVVHSVPGVSLATGRLLRQVRLERKGETAIVFASTLPEDDSRRLVRDAINAKLMAGRYIESGEHGKVTIGNDFAHPKKVFDKPVEVGEKITANGKEFEVVGILARLSGVGGRSDQNFIINEQDGRDLFKLSDNYDFLIVQVDSSLNAEQTAQSIERALRRSRDVDEDTQDFTVQTAAQFLETLDSILVIVQVVLVGIAAISLLVGGIGIMNTMYTAVLERTKEIGVMKAIGATNEDVLAIFVIESGMLGAVGGLIGLLIGMGLAKLVELVALAAFGSALIKASFPWYLLVGAVAFSFVVGSLSGLWPAFRAAKLKPVDALRYE